MNKRQNKNKRAFTLTELLIVVIVIGVLSAVAFPKFNQIIENRKVTEAEEMMSAVRTEQEHRCAMDKKYTLKLDNLSDIISSGKTKDYNYSLQAEGISAQSNKGDYTLKMLSYQDGSFCCTGDGCAKLNKNYPKCEGLTFPPSNCVGDDGTVEVGPDPEVPTPECTDGQTRGSQVCNTCGTQTTQACVGGKWVAQLGPCSKTVEECTPPECTNGQVSGSQSCNGCGTQTTKKCVSGKWVDDLGECSKTLEECTDNEDCCSYAIGSAQAQACLKKKYGENSREAKCSNYGNKVSCLRTLYKGGSALTYRCLSGSGDEDLKNDRNGYSGCKACKANKQVTNFFDHGFLNYACTGTVPECNITEPKPTDPGNAPITCYKIEADTPENFSYSSESGQRECVHKFSSGLPQCPPQIKEGVFINASHPNYTCWTTFSCPWSTYAGQRYTGVRYILKAKTPSKCTDDQMVGI